MSKKSKPRPQSAIALVRPPSTPSIHWTLAWVILAAAASIGYFRARPEIFLFDSTYILLEHLVKETGRAIAALFASPIQPSQGLAIVTLAMNRSICLMIGRPEFDPTSFVVGNIVLHAITTILLYHLLAALLARFGNPQTSSVLPIVMAVLFAVHPLHTSSVPFPVQRRGIMVAAFFMVGLLAYLKLREAKSTARRLGWLALLLAACWCCMKSKSIGIIMPLGVIALELALQLADPRALKRFIIGGGLLALTCIALMFIYLWSQSLFNPASMRLTPRDWGNSLDLWSHFLTQMRIIWAYWALTFLPLPAWLTPDHVVEPSLTLVDHFAWAAILGHVVILAAAIYAGVRRWPLTCAGILIFYVGMIPYPLLPQPEWMVEYRTYMSCVGVFIALAEIVNRVGRKVPRWTRAVAAVVVIAAMLAVTNERAFVYSDSLLLWKDAAAKSPNNHRAHSNLGLAYAKRQQYDDAIREYQESIRLQPNYPDAHFVLGLTLDQLQRYDDAITAYRRAQALMPYDLACHINISNALTNLGKLDEAVAELRKGIEIGLSAPSLRPTWRAPLTTDDDMSLLARACFNLGNTYSRMGNQVEAIEQYRAAIQYNPRHEKALYGLGLALLNAGQVIEAVEKLEAALAIKPDFSDATIHLQRALQILESQQAEHTNK
jgi:tetratricopeptide (TPR) repeat protein